MGEGGRTLRSASLSSAGGMHHGQGEVSRVPLCHLDWNKTLLRNPSKELGSVPEHLPLPKDSACVPWFLKPSRAARPSSRELWDPNCFKDSFQNDLPSSSCLNLE